MATTSLGFGGAAARMDTASRTQRNAFFMGCSFRLSRRSLGFVTPLSSQSATLVWLVYTMCRCQIALQAVRAARVNEVDRRYLLSWQAVENIRRGRSAIGMLTRGHRTSSEGLANENGK